MEKNKQLNGGTPTSDISGEQLTRATKNIKGKAPDPQSVQIDHIVPKSKGGTNHPSNAQVVSRKENIKKSNKQ